MKIQATSISIGSHAYLITGETNTGKSSLALALINQGAKLISDDITEIINGYAVAPENYRGWLEVRGIGLISGFDVCSRAKVVAIINLTENKPERMPSLKKGELPVFQIWTKDKNQVDKVLVIDKILNKTLSIESGKEV